MKRKFKLLTSVASLCLAIALMVGGVFAATNPTVAVNGTVSFTASNVYATVNVGTIHEGDDAYTMDTEVEFDAETEEPGDGEYSAEFAPELALTETVTEASYKVVITSGFATGSNATVIVEITSEIPASSDDIDVAVTATIDGEAATTPAKNGTYTLTAGQVLEVIVTCTVDPTTSNPVSAETPQDIALAFSLTRGVNE